MPVLPSSLLEPIWSEFAALLTEHRGGPLPEFDPTHPLGCHRRRAPDRTVFEHVVDSLVHGSGHERTPLLPGGPNHLWPNGPSHNRKEMFRTRQPSSELERLDM